MEKATDGGVSEQAEQKLEAGEEELEKFLDGTKPFKASKTGIGDVADALHNKSEDWIKDFARTIFQVPFSCIQKRY